MASKLRSVALHSSRAEFDLSGLLRSPYLAYISGSLATEYSCLARPEGNRYDKYHVNRKNEYGDALDTDSHRRSLASRALPNVQVPGGNI